MNIPVLKTQFIHQKKMLQNNYWWSWQATAEGAIYKLYKKKERMQDFSNTQDSNWVKNNQQLII